MIGPFAASSHVLLLHCCSMNQSAGLHFLAGKLGVGKTSIVEKAAGVLGLASLRGRIEVADVLAPLRVRNVVAGAVGVTSLRGKIVPSDGSVVSSDRYCSRNVYREIGVDPLAI